MNRPAQNKAQEGWGSGHVICNDGFECDVINIQDGNVLLANMKVNGILQTKNGRGLPPIKMSAKDAVREFEKTHKGIRATGNEPEPTAQEPIEEEPEEDIFIEEQDGQEEWGEETGTENPEEHDSLKENEIPEDIQDLAQQYQRTIEHTAREETLQQARPQTASMPQQTVNRSGSREENMILEKPIPGKVYQNPNSYSRTSSVISEDVVIEGNLKATTDIEMKGTIKGDITTEGDVTVTGNVDGNIGATQILLAGATVTGNIESKELAKIVNKATLVGDIKAKDAVVEGNVKGNIVCEESAQIKNEAVIYGNIKAKRIQIEDGVKTVGTVEVLGGDANLDDFFPAVKKAETPASPAKAEAAAKTEAQTE